MTSCSPSEALSLGSTRQTTYTLTLLTSTQRTSFSNISQQSHPRGVTLRITNNSLDTVYNWTQNQQSKTTCVTLDKQTTRYHINHVDDPPAQFRPSSLSFTQWINCSECTNVTHSQVGEGLTFVKHSYKICTYTFVYKWNLSETCCLRC